MNKQVVARSFSRNVATYDENAVIQREIATHLALLLDGVCSHGGNFFEVGCGTGLLTKEIIRIFSPSRYVVNDIARSMLDNLNAEVSQKLCFDAESDEWPMSLDAIVSASSVQWFDNPLAFTQKSYAALNESGTVGLATFGPKTFCEMQSLGHQGLSYPSLQEWRSAFKDNGFSVIRAESSIRVMHFKSVSQMLNSIRNIGATANSQRMSVSQLKKFSADYEHRFSDPEGIHLTYEVFYLIAKK